MCPPASLYQLVIALHSLAKGRPLLVSIKTLFQGRSQRTTSRSSESFDHPAPDGVREIVAWIPAGRHEGLAPYETCLVARGLPRAIVDAGLWLFDTLSAWIR